MGDLHNRESAKDGELLECSKDVQKTTTGSRISQPFCCFYPRTSIVKLALQMQNAATLDDIRHLADKNTHKPFTFFVALPRKKP